MKIDAPKKKIKAFNEKQVVGKMIASILTLKNEMEFFIYRFLISNTKNTKMWPYPIELLFDQLTSYWTLNPQQVIVELQLR